MPRPAAKAVLTRGLLVLLAVAAGLVVANLYYAQPLAARMADALRVGDAEVSGALVATQVGYALGMILLVPLGDGRERRGTIVATVAAAVPALLLVAFAPSILWLTIASLLVGFASAVPQLILPYAVDLAPREARGKVVGFVMSGLLTGVLLSRTASGAIGSLVGWRAVFVGGAVLMAVLAVTLRFAIPMSRPEAPMKYGAILRSLREVFQGEPILRRRALVGALGFGSFSVFWSMLSFHLQRFGYGSGTAGLYGVLGVAGVLVAPIAGRLATRERPALLNVVSLLSVVASFALMAVLPRSLVAIGAGVVLMDAGAQASHLTNQTVIFGLSPLLRGRLNALYMVGYFAGGAAGTAVAALAWAAGGWTLVCVVGGAFAMLGIAALGSELGELFTKKRAA